MTSLEDRLVTLRDRMSVAFDGYDQARDGTGDAHLQRVFERACVEHSIALEKVRPFLPADVADDAGGTLIGTLTKAIVSVRKAVGSDASLLPGMIDGQSRVLEACDEALAAAGAEPQALAALQDVRARLVSVLDDLEACQAAEA